MKWTSGRGVSRLTVWGTMPPTPSPESTRMFPYVVSSFEAVSLEAASFEAVSAKAFSLETASFETISFEAVSFCASSQAAAFLPASSPSSLTKSTRSWTWRTLPQENMPGMLVWRSSVTRAPFVARLMAMPALSVSSFSGMRPAEMRRVSQEISNSVPGMRRRFSSTFPTRTEETRSLPRTSEMTEL